MFQGLKSYDTFEMPAGLMMSKKRRSKTKKHYDPRSRTPASAIGSYQGLFLTFISTIAILALMIIQLDRMYHNILDSKLYQKRLLSEEDDHEFLLDDSIYMPFISFGMNDVSAFQEIKRNIFKGERLDVAKLSEYFEL